MTSLIKRVKRELETADPRLVALLARKPVRVTTVAMANPPPGWAGQSWSAVRHTKPGISPGSRHDDLAGNHRDNGDQLHDVVSAMRLMANRSDREQGHNPLDCQLLVIDDAGMVEVMLMHATLKALPPSTALLLVGGVDQEPSVGAGQVLKDIIGSGAVPIGRLTKVFRQAGTGRIIINAHRINAGECRTCPPAARATSST